jgi:hypothetical protein
VRFGLAQVARSEADLGPALERALAQRPEPDGSFARRPSTASLILGAERRARQLPVWRVRTARAATTTVAALAVAGWTLTTGTSYTLVSHFVHMRPVTAVATTRPEVGVLVDAPADEVPSLASALSADGIHVSFALEHAPTSGQLSALSNGDQTVPRLKGGGLVRWFETGDQLHHLTMPMGFGHHFLYASSGPSVGQWVLANRAGGRLIAGAVRMQDGDDALGRLRAGEVIEMSVTGATNLLPLVEKLHYQLQVNHLQAVPVGKLLRDAGATV